MNIKKLKNVNRTLPEEWLKIFILIRKIRVLTKMQ